MTTFNILGLPPGLPLEIWGPFLLQSGGSTKRKGYLHILPQLACMAKNMGFSKPVCLDILLSNFTVKFYHPQQRVAQLLFRTVGESMVTQAPKGPLL